MTSRPTDQPGGTAMSVFDAPVHLDPAWYTDAELSEMAGVPDPEAAPEVPESDIQDFLSETYSDPAEADGPCCGDPLCMCGGYTGNYHGGD